MTFNRNQNQRNQKLSEQSELDYKFGKIIDVLDELDERLALAEAQINKLTLAFRLYSSVSSSLIEEPEHPVPEEDS